MGLHRDLVLHRQLPAPRPPRLAKALWFLFIVFVPIIGVFSYLLTRPATVEVVPVDRYRSFVHGELGRPSRPRFVCGPTTRPIHLIVARCELEPGVGGRDMISDKTSSAGAALIALATAQFVMVLDQSVMNVSISHLVADFDTTVTTIQAVITLYCLVMAMFMMTGAKVGDIIGRRRAFVVGLVIYGCGSPMTALSPTVAVLTLGWSILEGIGAALVLPALAALIAGNFAGARRKAAYAVIGGVAGAGIAVGPIVGGWATTELSWRVVFVGEVFFATFILVMTGKVKDAPGPTPTPNSTTSARCSRPRASASSCSACSSRAPGDGSSRRTPRSPSSASH